MTTSTESRGLPFIVATFFGVGLSPVAPGTIGSIAALPLAVLLLHWPILFSSMTLLVLFVLGTYSGPGVPTILSAAPGFTMRKLL